MKINFHYVSNDTGWRLALKQTIDPVRHNPSLRPLVLIPGYGNNAFMFAYHPRDISMEEYMAEKGFEVWSLSLRGQEPSRREGGSREYNISDVATIDLPVAIDYILANNISGSEKVDIIGASLGGTFVFVYLTLMESRKVGSLVAIGSPLRWVEVHPLVAVMFCSPWLVETVKINHIRTFYRYALPVLTRAPYLLNMYIHPEIVDFSRPDMLARTVDNPSSRLNAEISRWLKTKDLIINGKNITKLMKNIENPLLCIYSNADGIVPGATAASVLDAVSSEVKTYFVTGDRDIHLGHADMFVSDYARPMVFRPIARWLLEQN